MTLTDISGESSVQRSTAASIARGAGARPDHPISGLRASLPWYRL